MYLLLASLLVPTASAEVRLFNGTGQPLVVDVLHADKQERDIQLPVGHTLSRVLGVPLDKHKSEEMLVVRDASGTELKREKVQTDGIYAINNWGSGVIFNAVGRFQNGSADSSALQLVNATGKVLQYKVEMPDFSVREGRGRDPKDGHAIEANNIANAGREGEERKVTITVVGSEPLTVELGVGSPFLITNDGGKLAARALP